MKRTIRGEDYKLVILRVTDWDELGRPKAATIGYDDVVFDLRDEKQSREFMTCWIPAKMCKPVTRGH